MPDTSLQSNPKVREFLMGIEIYDVLDRLVEEYSISQEREEEFLDLADAVMNGRLPIGKMPDFIKEAFAVSPEDAKLIAIELTGHRLLPLTSYLPEIEKQLIAWGADLSSFPDLRIQDDPITVNSLLREQADKLGLKLPEHLMKRFVYLGKGYITKERSHEATVTIMQRPLTIGGLGLTQEQVEQLLGWLDEVDLTTAVDFKAPGSGTDKVPTSSPQDEQSAAPPRDGQVAVQSVPTPAPEPKVVPTPEPKPKQPAKPLVQSLAPVAPTALTTSVPVIAGELIEDHEKHEIDAHTRALKNVAPVESGIPLPPLVEKAATLLIDHAPAKKLAKKKAASLAEAVLKGRLETGRLYQQLKELHGFDAKSAQAVMKPMVEMKKEWEASHVGAAFMPPVEDRSSSQDERTLMDRRHAALTKTPSKQSVEPVLPGARVSAARTKQEELTAQNAKVNVEAEREAKAKDRPAPAKVMLSKPSVPPKPMPKEKTTVTDVRFTPTLVGPVQELGTMTAADFRRLSSEPSEAARKVLDTLSLLEETDYEERIAGVAAWRKSPINQLYLQMVNEGLHTGHSVAEIASARRNQGQESLSPTELQAIVSLNTQMKF